MADNKVFPIGSESNKGQKDLNEDQVATSMQSVAELVKMLSQRKPMERSEEIEWFQKHIQIKKCLSYKSSDGKNICQCGYSKEKHTSNVESQPSEREKEPTNAYGEIKFKNAGGNTAKFARVDSDTDTFTILELMMQVWKMGKPNLLLSVAGSAKSFEMKPRLRDACQRGLMKALQGTGAWIITDGTHAGVMKYIGNVVKDLNIISEDKNPIITIGITPWGIIDNKQNLLNEQGSWPAEYFIKKKQKHGENFLDPYHSHIILVDTGINERTTTKNKFRENLESTISRIPIDTGDAAMGDTKGSINTSQENTVPPVVEKAAPVETEGTNYTSQEQAVPPEKDVMYVPVVLLVLEWSADTLETLHTAINKNIPAVVMKISDRKGDILTKAFQTVDIDARYNPSKKSKKSPGSMSEGLKQKIRKDMKEIRFCKEQEIETKLSRICDCRSKSDLIYVCEWNRSSGDFDIDVAILKAISKATTNNVKGKDNTINAKYQLKLALAWNRIDIAKSEIFSDENRRVVHGLEDVMLSAILQDRVDFVELILDNGCVPKKFLTLNRLLELYNKVAPRSVFKVLLSKMNIKNEEVAPRSVCKFLMSKMKLKKKEEISTIELKHVEKLIQHLLADSNFQFTRHTYKADEDKNHPLETKTTGGNMQNKPDEDNPSLDLLIWSVLNNRQGMAKLFWRHGKNAMAAALFAHALFSAMSLKVDDRELEVEFEKHAGEFLNLAIGVLKECHTTDDTKAHELLIRHQSQWGKTSCVLIAVKAENKQFISEPACQELFNNIWKGEISNQNGTLKLLLCIAVPLLILCWATFKEKRHGKEDCALPPSQRNVKMKPKSETLSSQGKPNMGRTSQKSQDSKCCLHWKKITSFYTTPVIIFFQNVISYMVFLGLYSYILISKIDIYLSWEEILLCVWVFSIFTQEVIQAITTPSMNLKSRLWNYIADGWNKLDLATTLLFLLGMGLRTSSNPYIFEIARIVFGVNLVTFFLRLLHIFSVHRELGPKLVMIKHMVYNLAYFFVIFLVFILAYAVSSYAILHPNSEISLNTVISIFRRPYWNIYGELLLNEIEEDPQDCTIVAELYRNGTYSRCPSETGKYFVQVLMGFYMLMCNILLLNLLIAMFSSSFQKGQDSSYMYWRLQQYSLINEYANRPFLAPPLIMFVHLYQLIRYIATRCSTKPKKEINWVPVQNVFLKKDVHTDNLHKWEDIMAKKFYQNGIRLENNSNTVNEASSTNLEKRMENIELQLKWIVKSLKQNNLGAKDGGIP